MKIKYDFEELKKTAAEIQNSREPVYFMSVLESLDELEKELGNMEKGDEDDK